MYKFLFSGALFLGAATLQADYNQYPAADSSNQARNNAQMSEQTVPLVKAYNHPQLGQILTDSRGMTLYVYTPDDGNASTCYDQCAMDWPPLVLPSNAPILAPGVKGALDVAKRKEGSRQVTYNGKPLYYYAKDKKPGDALGQKVDNKWFVVQIETGS